MRDKRVVLTGGTGFIGRYLPKILERANYEVHVISRTNQGSSESIFFYDIDLMDFDRVNELLKSLKPTHLLHLAWNVKHSEFWESAENLSWIVASINLIRSFQDNGGRRAVVAGTCAEYDWELGVCKEEVTPLKPVTLYGESKKSLYSLMSNYCAQTDMEFSWGRIFHLYGPYENTSRFVSSVITQMINGDKVQCSHGNQLRDFMYVEDVAGAFAALLDSDVSGPVNIGSGEPVPLRKIVTLLSDISDFTGDIDFGSISVSDNDPAILLPTVDRLRNEVVFQHSVDLSAGLLRTYEHILQND